MLILILVEVESNANQRDWISGAAECGPWAPINTARSPPYLI